MTRSGTTCQARNRPRGKRRVGSLILAAGVLLVGACSRNPATRSADDVVALNNRGVGLMGQFDYEQARDVFSRLAAQHPEQSDLQVNLAIATLNRQHEGDGSAALQILER